MATIQEDSLELLIIKLVTDNQGLKGVDLIVRVMAHNGPVEFNYHNYINTLTRLVADGKIVEMMYTLPSMTYRIKSIYFPMGTQVCQEKNSNQKSELGLSS